VVLYLLCRMCSLVCRRMATVFPSSLVQLVNSRLGPNPFRGLFPGSGQCSYYCNSWYGPFYDLIQAALSKSSLITLEQFYNQLATFAQFAFMAVAVGVLTRFFVSHYIFRWRSAMNNYYTEHWDQLRSIEGASQRVQEDTMRFASTMEGLGVNLIDALMTLIAFLPVLVRLSSNVIELPLVGQIPQPLVFAAVI